MKADESAFLAALASVAVFVTHQAEHANDPAHDPACPMALTLMTQSHHALVAWLMAQGLDVTRIASTNDGKLAVKRACVDFISDVSNAHQEYDSIEHYAQACRVYAATAFKTVQAADPRMSASKN